jgi:hypothetical protein
MIGLFLLLSAQTAAQPFCVRAVGSEIVVCGLPPQQLQGSYRLPQLPSRIHGPMPSIQPSLGHGVRLRGQTSNSGPARRNRSTATLSVPF